MTSAHTQSTHSDPQKHLCCSSSEAVFEQFELATAFGLNSDMRETLAADWAGRQHVAAHTWSSDLIEFAKTKIGFLVVGAGKAA